MIELRFRTLITTTLVSLLALLALVAIFGVLRYQQFSAIPRPSRVVTEAVSAPDLIAPVLDAPAIALADAASTWDVSFTVPPETVQAAITYRYPGLRNRFPDGVLLTIVDGPHAPESLRGPYDQTPTELLAGAVYPQPHPGERILPDAEAWAGCRRDLELGPARQLHCYLFARGEAGDTLDGLAALAWVQALDIALSGSSQPLQPASLPLVNITPEENQWTYADSYLALTPAALPVPSSSP